MKLLMEIGYIVGIKVFLFEIRNADSISMENFIYYWITLIGIECASIIAWYLYKLDKNEKIKRELPKYNSAIYFLMENLNKNRNEMGTIRNGYSLFDILEKNYDRNIDSYINYIDTEGVSDNLKCLKLIEWKEECQLTEEIESVYSILFKFKSCGNRIEKDRYKNLKKNIDKCIEAINNYNIRGSN
ncbi:MAG: hypothetical protein N4A40_10600 [Tissierellales bacterium]|nr:hypothetical protein [Tissierellales bacterium]